MFNIFQLKDDRLFLIDEISDIASYKNKIVWVDIIKPSDDECNYIQAIFNSEKIDFLELKNIKKNVRFFRNEYGLSVHSIFFSYDKCNQINNSVVSFSIYNDCLYTIREEKSPIFCMYKQSLHNRLLVNGNAYELLLNLFELKIDDISNKVERICNTLESLGSMIMGKQYRQIDEYNRVLLNLSELENVNWKIRINLLDTERVIRFLIYKIKLPVVQNNYAKEILDNINLLLTHNECILQKVSFLTNASMGFINIEQNRIIKIFSIIFLPPTLIASSYGMNFEFMPELQWSFGYPSAICLMILAGVVPYIYFKHKNWL